MASNEESSRNPFLPPLSLPFIETTTTDTRTQSSRRSRLIGQDKKKPEGTNVEEIIIFNASDLGPLIRINVGGERFSTSTATLTRCAHEKEHLLQVMFSGQYDLPKDDKGCVFIDRDPKYFRHILNWLRAPQLPLLGEIARVALLKEAQFFQLKGMAKALTEVTNNSPENSIDQLQLILAISKMKLGTHTVNLSGLQLMGLRLVGMEMKGAWFYETNLQNAQLCYSNLHQTKFIKANLQFVDFSFAELTNSNFSGANLKGALFRGCTKLFGVTMSGADLTGIDLSQQNLTNVNFQGANLTKVNLSGANLSNTNFQGANLTNANLSSSNLQMADLSQAICKSTNFAKSNLSSGKLCGATLTGAIIAGTNFSEVDFTGAKLPDDFRKNKPNVTGAKGLS